MQDCNGDASYTLRDSRILEELLNAIPKDHQLVASPLFEKATRVKLLVG